MWSKSKQVVSKYSDFCSLLCVKLQKPLDITRSVMQLWWHHQGYSLKLQKALCSRPTEYVIHLFSQVELYSFWWVNWHSCLPVFQCNLYCQISKMPVLCPIQFCLKPQSKHNVCQTLHQPPDPTSALYVLVLLSALCLGFGLHTGWRIGLQLMIIFIID